MKDKDRINELQFYADMYKRRYRVANDGWLEASNGWRDCLESSKRQTIWWALWSIFLIIIECKINGYLKPLEKKKIEWLKEKNIFDGVWLTQLVDGNVDFVRL